jgi:alkaline phosphatase
MANESSYKLINTSLDGLGNRVSLYFDVQIDTTNIPEIAQFTVSNGGTVQTVSSLQVVNNQVLLTLAAPLDSDKTILVSYTDATAGNDVKAIQDKSGNDIASFQDIEVSNTLGLTASGTESFAFASTISLDGAEISAFDAASGRLFVTSFSGIQVVSVDADLQMTLLGTISLGTNDVNSVAVKNGIVAVAVAAADKTQPGSVYFLNADGVVGDASMIYGSVAVGALPDMLTFSDDGKTVLVANEGEQDTLGNNPEGSVSIIDLSNGVAAATVKTASFAAFNDKLVELQAAGVRLFAGETGFETITVAKDLEPEYISISPDGKTAFVTLQENNAIGILDIATGTFTDIVPLGLKSFLGLPFDGSDKDGAGDKTSINLQSDQPVFGQRMPDSISSFTGADGKTYYIIANEGDDRDDFIAPDETARLSTLDLDNTLFPNESTLKTNAEIGRLTVSNAPGNNGDTDGDGDIDQILTYGARSFSILNADGTLVFDSASHIEQFVALGGVYTGAGGTGLFDDTRSDNKGPEPEGITIGHVGDKTLAFVGLERGGGGVMVYDITNPQNVSFVQYLRNAGDESPEGLTFVSSEGSPNDQALLVVTNEVSKTVSLFRMTNINDAPTVATAIGDVTTEEEHEFTLMIPVQTFNDVDSGDSLTYTATLADGSPLPSWLTFDNELQGALKYSTTATDSYFSQAGKWPATDSASAATAIGSGVKTDAGNIAWQSGDPVDGEITTIAETLRADLGFAIGVVSTVPFSHATPASFVSHNVNRNNYQDIAHEILFDTQPEVVIGGGLDSLFAKAVTNAAKADTDLDNNGYNDDYDAFKTDTDATLYTFVERANGVDGGTLLAAVAAGVDITAGEKLFGLFGTSSGNFEYYNVADTPGTPTITRSTTDTTPSVDEDPTLAEMTSATLSVLNKDTDGFFVMFEQGDIDWSNHSNDYENMVGGVVDLEQAVTTAETIVATGVSGMNWSNTLMIVTSDHSNSYLRLQEELGKGNLPAQTVVAGKQTYADGEVTYSTTGHTNELVTLQARGAGAELFKEYAGLLYPGTNIVDNTQIYEVMMSAAKDQGVEHIVLFIGDGMNIEHEIAGSQYLYGKDFGLTWQDWGQLEDGWSGYASTWDVSSYNTYALAAAAATYSTSSFDPLIGYDPSKGGETPLSTGVMFSGTPTHSNVGSIELKVTATDESGAKASDIFTLKVEDTTAPAVVTFSPSDSLAGVAIGSNIELFFSERIRTGTGTIAIHSGSSSGEVVESYNAATSDKLTISDSTLTINPTADLKYQTQYFVTFSEGSLLDNSGNLNAGITAYDFTTGADPFAENNGGASTGTVLAGVGALGVLAWLLI